MSPLFNERESFPAARRATLLAMALLLPSIGGAGFAQEAQPELQAEPSAPTEAWAPTVDPPQFLAGVAANLSDIGGSIFYWGQAATIDGAIRNNAVVGGANVTVEQTGRVEGDLVAFASTVVINGEIMRDVYAWAAEVRFGKDARVHGNVMAFAGRLRLDGAIYGVVRGGGGQTVVLGEVGDIDLEAGTLTIGPDAVVHGDVVYQSNEEAEIDPGARIDGQVTRNVDKPDAEDEDAEEDAAGGVTFWSVAWRGWRYLASLVVGLTALLLGGAGARAPARRLLESPASALGFGFVVSIVVPVACVLAVLLLVTALLGLASGVLFVLAVYAGGLVTAQSAGQWLLQRLMAREPSEYLALALGLLLLMPLAWIPYVGFLLRYFAAVLGLGAIYLALRDAGFPWTTGGSPAPVPSQ